MLLDVHLLGFSMILSEFDFSYFPLSSAAILGGISSKVYDFED